MLNPIGGYLEFQEMKNYLKIKSPLDKLFDKVHSLQTYN